LGTENSFTLPKANVGGRNIHRTTTNLGGKTENGNLWGANLTNKEHCKNLRKKKNVQQPSKGGANRPKDIVLWLPTKSGEDKRKPAAENCSIWTLKTKKKKREGVNDPRGGGSVQRQGS